MLGDADFFDPGAVGQPQPSSPQGPLATLRSPSLRRAIAMRDQQPANPPLVPGIDSQIPDVLDASGGQIPWPDNLSLWDVVFIGTTRLPGLARVSGLRRHKFDAPSAAAQQGEDVYSLGADPGEFNVALTLWTPQQFSDLRAILPSLLPKPTAAGVSPQAQQFFHPGLYILGITTGYVVQATVPHHIGKGIFEIELQCVEFLPVLALPILKKVDVATEVNKPLPPLPAEPAAKPSPANDPSATGP